MTQVTDTELCERGHDLIRSVLERIGDKWSVVVICKLADTTRGFNELRRLSGPSPITQRMLSATLRRLERDGLESEATEGCLPTFLPVFGELLRDLRDGLIGRQIHPGSLSELFRRTPGF